VSIIEDIKKELRLEAEAIQLVAEKIDESIEKVIDLLSYCEGKVVVTGMGKTGIIARKIAATLASTGTTSIFLHSAEGVHGDLGMLNREDVMIAVSYSGNSDEMISMIPYIKFLKVPIIAITGNIHSRLAQHADFVIDVEIPKEFEPFGLVPTCSTTVSLAIGDAIAIALLKRRNFNENDFAKYHPGGTIGKKLLLKVKDLMHVGEQNPIVDENTTLDKIVLEMTSKKLGCTNVINAQNELVGMITDGDLRRLLTKGFSSFSMTAKEVMTTHPRFVLQETLAIAALNVMEDKKITMLPVLDENHHAIGMLHMHDLINAGVVG
jgi:arabinose-5-phosphate isomerase